MKAKCLLCALMLPAFALTGCGDQVSPPTESETDTTTTTTVTELTTTTGETTSATESTTGTADSTEATTSTTAATAPPVAEAPDSLFAVVLPESVKPAETSEPDESSETKEPDESSDSEPAVPTEKAYPFNFNYVFTEEAVGLRLDGGTYQTISFDFSQIIRKDGTLDYRLYDCNFDGDPDLLIPLKKDDNKQICAMFIWNNSTKKFYETAITAENPTFSAEKKQYTTIGTLSSKQSVMVTGYQWSGAAPGISFIVYGDYKSNALTFKDNATGKTETKNYDTADALTAALSDYRK
jgi:hypothetical protein